MKRLVPLLLVLALIGCATAQDEELEEARFALDRGDWAKAISTADEVLAGEPSNVGAGLILAAAYAGRGGFKLLDLATIISNDIHRRDLFGAIHDFVVFISGLNHDDIRTAIITLLERIIPEPPFGHMHFIDYQFQVGILMVIEAYTLPTVLAQPNPDGPIDTNAITEAIKDIVLSDLIDYDDHLTDAGLSESDSLIRNARETYCVLHNVSQSAEGFDVEALRDLVLCQLSDNDGADLTEENFQSQLVSSCSDFDYGACEGAGDTEL